MKFRKKPVEIEAEQYTKYGKLVKGMCNSQTCFVSVCNEPHVHTIYNNQIVLLEIGDWIIPEADGEHFYTCKPDIFEQTYDANTLESGSVCTKCKSGKIALMSTFVGCADLDDEPYTNGVAERSNETITFEDYVSLSIHACDECGHVFDVFVE